MLIYEKLMSLSHESLRPLRIILANKGIKRIEDLIDEDGFWKERDSIINAVKSMRRVGVDDFVEFMETMREIGTLDITKLEVSKGWYWSNAPKQQVGWIHPNKTWVGRIHKRRDEVIKLNRRWSQSGTPENWRCYWRQLWRGWTLLAVRMWVWRLIHHGFANNRALKW